MENNHPDSMVNSNQADTGEITYLALGDSYTIGESVAEPERFPVQLVTILKNDQIKIDAPDIEFIKLKKFLTIKNKLS